MYIAALWYTINLITITGMGDVSSQNDFEVIETIIVIIIIKFCTGITECFIYFHKILRDINNVQDQYYSNYLPITIYLMLAGLGNELLSYFEYYYFYILILDVLVK